MANRRASTKSRDLKRDRILRAAGEVFASRGFNGSRIADIADRAVIGKGTVYEYFSSKEDLFFAVFERLIDEMYTAMDSGIASRKAGESVHTLRNYAITGMTFFDQARELTPLWLEYWAASSAKGLKRRFRDEFRKVYRRFRELIARTIDKGIKVGEFRKDVKPREVAAAFVGIFDGLILQSWFEPRLRAREAAIELASHLVRGMRPTHQGKSSSGNRK